jgi:hypothetical protein
MQKLFFKAGSIAAATRESERLLGRRRFLRAAAGSGGLALMTLGLAACGGGGDPGNESALAVKKAAADTKLPLDTPTLACAGASQSSITVRFTAGASGAPAGFSLQWMKKADYDLAGWPASDSIGLCEAGFSGNANLSRYELAAGESVDVEVGDFLFDNGASTDCMEPLECGVTYVFRAFAHATSASKRSEWSANLECATLACTQVVVCTYTQGYWKTHGPIPTGNNTNQWPVASLTLGSVGYTDLQLLAILNTQPGGNGLVALAHQLIATKLNIANGSDATAIAAAVANADALIAGLVVPPLPGSGSLVPKTTDGLTHLLDDYNNGLTGPGHCGSE